MPLIIGVDEVGWGAIAGPICVCAAIADAGWSHRLVKDSKKFSSLTTLLETADFIKGRKDVRHHCELGMIAECVTPADWLDATAHRAVLPFVHEHRDEAVRVVFDGGLLGMKAAKREGRWKALPAKWSVESMPGADATIAAVSAASIMAKAHRETWLSKWLANTPAPEVYGMAEHRGYPTPAHLAALAEYGPSAMHRPWTKPVQRAAEQRHG